MCLEWFEYEANREGLPDVETVLKGKADAYCCSTARRYFPKLSRKNLKSSLENDAEFKNLFEKKRDLVIASWKRLSYMDITSCSPFM